MIFKIFSYILSVVFGIISIGLITICFALIDVDRKVAIGLINENEKQNGLQDLSGWTVDIVSFLHKEMSYKQIQKYMLKNLGWNERIKTLALITALKIEMDKRP